MNMHSAGIHTASQVEEILNSPSAKAIHEYHALLEDSETPRTFLTWSLLGSVAALLGSHGKIRQGPYHTIPANLFIVLLGPPGVRKSSAINMTLDFLEGTSVYYGPTDTGGQRHGIMAALTGLHRPRVQRPTGHLTFESDVSHIHPVTYAGLHPRPANDMFFAAPELGRLFGTGSTDMANFFNDLYDGEVVKYQTKASEIRLETTTVSLLGATTPASLAQILDSSATGHGILSRILFIYADERHKAVPIPGDKPEEWYDGRDRFKHRLEWIDDNRSEFTLSPVASDTFEGLYDYVPILDEPRLEYYRERRANMMLRIAMCISALRNDNRIIDTDVRLSHELLASAEPNMRRALEFFGRNKVYAGRNLILQYIRQAGPGGADPAELIAAAASELNRKEAEEAIQSMQSSGEIVGSGSRLILGEARNEILKLKMTFGGKKGR